MTPSARISAAIAILDHVLDGQPAEQALLRWSRASRFAGSGDRAAVRDLVFDALRRRNSLAALGGAAHGRGLMIGCLRAAGQDPNDLFTGLGYAPEPLTAAEAGQGEDDDVVDLPDWIWPIWRESLAGDAVAVAKAMRDRAPVWLRANPIRGDALQAAEALARDAIEVEPHAGLRTALRVTGGERRVAQSSAYRDGLVELQDLSPQLACAALPLRPGDHVLDYCAGGGGKALALAGLQPHLRILAHDADTARMRDLPARARRAGAIVECCERPFGRFDLVVADVPCSGSGTWRRNPDAKWRLTPAGLASLLTTQAAILDEVAGLVAPGGHLAYMTCSILGDENARQIDAFLGRHDAFSLVSRSLWTPLNASDGFFMALLCRRA
ncbi:RsmB/NOP family class I SAM-dependent RNA methyltransferase [Paracoccus salsus]|uniref:RsmB/NOP family class I SAM-dependent RNA methyltransferase n=1 Tax=Paracoccus salsus TaxID=2911061 RepID=UPI001F16635A|nr:RsmB/NOP family class I SAM-dependent RNA methyltransferase [Paracoccus salsus]MCF3974012.1 RsmB/NOP family class I SAM-dependent RNA methyltransferase [Paracoccus salsus]